MVLVLAVGMHHASPLMGIGDSGHHSTFAGPANGAGHDDTTDGLAATCLAILTLALAIPRMLRPMVRLAAWVHLIPTAAWATRLGVMRGPPPRDSRPPFLLLCTLRR